MTAIEDKNVPSRREQVLIQVQLIYSLQFVTMRKKKSKAPVSQLVNAEVAVKQYSHQTTVQGFVDAMLHCGMRYV